MRPKLDFVYMYVLVRREREREGGEGVAYVFKSGPIGLRVILEENPLYGLEFEFLSLDSHARTLGFELYISHIRRSELGS